MRRTLVTIDRELKAPPTKINIQAGSVRVIPDVGIGGYTNPDTGEVKITMDHRSLLGVERLLEVWLPIVMAHELHHTKRILDGPGYGATLLEALVTEGSAEAFVRETYPAAPEIAWVAPMTAEEEALTWQRLGEELDSPYDGARHEAWFYGTGGRPRWAGYKVGYLIARTYLERHADRTAADLATMSAREILHGSGLESRYG